MPRLIQPTEAAIADFDRIYDFLSKRSPRAAANVLRKLDAAIQRLADQPKLGRAYAPSRGRLRLLVHGD